MPSRPIFLSGTTPTVDTEPAWQVLIDRRRISKQLPPYQLRTPAEIEQALSAFLRAVHPGSRVTSISRLGGGASKEQFVFTMDQDGARPGAETGRYVLRTDPQCPIIETDCRREFAILSAVAGIIPSPRPVWVDVDGRFFGRPAMVTAFVPGVTKPRNGADRVSGLGTALGEPLRSKLKNHFMDILVDIHSIDWRRPGLEGLTAPDADATQAARWSLNFWDALWQLDSIEDRPIITLARCWLRANLPDCAELVLTHGDYRTGNYLFDQDAGRIEAVLDWELSRIGDFHEDLGWILLRLFGVVDGGVFRASDLYEREEFIQTYESRTGRTINRDTLRFYEVLSLFKCYIVVAASGLSVARGSHSHQDVLLTYMGGAAAMFAHDIAIYLSEGGNDASDV